LVFMAVLDEPKMPFDIARELAVFMRAIAHTVAVGA